MSSSVSLHPFSLIYLPKIKLKFLKMFPPIIFLEIKILLNDKIWLWCSAQYVTSFFVQSVYCPAIRLFLKLYWKPYTYKLFYHMIPLHNNELIHKQTTMKDHNPKITPTNFWKKAGGEIWTTVSYGWRQVC